jgi:MoCo/4Fe-4S cofactor protein with predicted Tat translocation signal
MSKRQPYQFEKPTKGKTLWTSLEAKADPEAFQERANAEFPMGAHDVQDTGLFKSSRRTFLGVAGAAGAMLGLEGCIRRPEEHILPFTKQPEYVLPGIALHYATAMRVGGDVLGLLVSTHEGRPTKVEGNPQHPTSLGGTDGYAQATILDLYDPDRSHGPAVKKGDALEDVTFKEADALLDGIAAKAGKGEKLRVLARPSQSPTFVRVKKELLKKFPEAKVYSYEPVSDAARSLGAKLAFGQHVDVSYNYRRARVIVALDADILGTEPGSVRAAREFADGRRLTAPTDSMNRLYVAEPGFTVTGASADHRLRMPAGDVAELLKALAKELDAKGAIKDPEPARATAAAPAEAEGAEAPPADAAGSAAALPPPYSYEALRSAVHGAKAPASVGEKWVKAVAKELADSAVKGRSVIVVGSRQPAAVHALAFALNHALGNMNRTVVAVRALDNSDSGPTDDIEALAKEISGGGVESLLILGGNPVIDAPADLGFGELLAKVPTSVHLSEFRDDTSHKCSLHVPRAHAFETWGDLRSSDGTLSIQQPLIAPLYGGRSDSEVIAKLAGIEWWRGHPLVRATLRSELPGESFEQQWKSGLYLGLVRDLTATAIGELEPKCDVVASALRKLPEAAAVSSSSLEVNFAADPKLYDGVHNNNPWMLELPDPLSTVCWDNAAYVSPETAKALGIQSMDVVTLKSPEGGSLDIVTWVLPGQTDNTVTLHLGWGRKAKGRYGVGAGFDVYPLRTTKAFGFGSGFSLAKTGKRYPVSVTQETHSMQGRPIAIDATLEEYKKEPEFAEFRSPVLSTLPLWTEVKYEGARWSMVIDLNACTGCNSCLVACQAENNVSSVGKQQVARGRDMFWLRLDRYFVGDDENNPQVAFQPIGCQHCEEAPCENVCPVNATAHSPEGLNDMAYNRCIGTRYCMNNCPYKVRRFNFLDFTGQVAETRRMQYNPNVSVRMRGTMEKCSYCVQRIQEAKISAKRDDRKLRDGEIKTACQQACPSGCITFGDLNDPSSRVAKLSKLDRQYKLIPEVGTQPRTSFLAKIRNPNPELVG